MLFAAWGHCAVSIQVYGMRLHLRFPVFVIIIFTLGRISNTPALLNIRASYRN